MVSVYQVCTFAGSNYSVTFRNIPAGTHSLRIVAENNNKDKLVMKIKIYVSGTDALCCAVNLINNRITYIMDNSVMIYFKSTNSATQFRCSLNRQPSFECKLVRYVYTFMLHECNCSFTHGAYSH